MNSPTEHEALEVQHARVLARGHFLNANCAPESMHYEYGSPPWIAYMDEYEECLEALAALPVKERRKRSNRRAIIQARVPEVP